MKPITICGCKIKQSKANALFQVFRNSKCLEEFSTLDAAKDWAKTFKKGGVNNPIKKLLCILLLFISTVATGQFTNTLKFNSVETQYIYPKTEKHPDGEITFNGFSVEFQFTIEIDSMRIIITEDGLKNSFDIIEILLMDNGYSVVVCKEFKAVISEGILILYRDFETPKGVVLLKCTYNNQN